MSQTYWEKRLGLNRPISYSILLFICLGRDKAKIELLLLELINDCL